MTGKFDKFILYAILTVCVSLIIILIYRGYCILHYPECKYEFHSECEIIKPMLGFSGWNLYMDLSHQAQGSGLNVILNLFFGTAINAAYGIGLQLSKRLIFYCQFYACRHTGVKTKCADALHLCCKKPGETA